MILKYQFSETKRILDDASIAKIIDMGNANIEPAKIDISEAGIKNHRLSSVSWFKRNEQTEFFYKPLLQMIYLENVNNNWNFDYDVIEDLQFTKYEGSKKQHYDWHADQRSIPYSSNDVSKELAGKIRKISFSIILNTDYTGGNFEFEVGAPHEKNRTEVLTPKLGCAIVFPSFMFHRVTPVTEGTRYSLVGWICGKPYR
mgnify:CR=1 FL=1|tara:strand:- start:480 stop:1079 length:600 start_codon:yes stop_codon:yes gene_type:complete